MARQCSASAPQHIASVVLIASIKINNMKKNNFYLNKRLQRSIHASMFRETR